MKIRHREDREQEIMAKLRSRPRLEGRHLTDSIYCNVKAWAFARLAAAGEEVHFDDGTLLRMERGNLRGAFLEEGQMSQVPTISRDDDSVGTIDVWRGFVVEAKSTEISVNRDVAEMDHWVTQLGGYVARNIRDGAKTARGELWIIHERGDHGKKRCIEHGYPERDVTAVWEETGKKRKICPTCRDENGEVRFLEDGNRDPVLRCWELTWTREELASLHEILTARQADLKADIENTEYQPGNPPPIRHGYDFECEKCPVKERIGCPGRGNNLEQQLEDSLMATGKSIEEITEEVYSGVTN